MVKLDTDYGTFKQLIDVSKIYTVPLYQRRYSWNSNDQVAELWTDILRLYRERRDGGRPQATHFVGSVVVGETEDKALGPGACNVIDGQQRLTTLSLIVAAIRDILVTDETARDDISTSYLLFPKTGQMRLVLSQGDAPQFEAIVKGETPADRRSLIYRAYNYIARELERGFQFDTDPDASVEGLADGAAEVVPTSDDVDLELPDTSSGGSVGGVEASGVEPFVWRNLLAVIATDLELVSISGVPAERAYQIFATLNHGGLKLNQVDLIRNAVFMKLPTLNKIAYEKIWRPLEERLEPRSLERFLHAWVIRRGHDVPKKDTYASVMEELKVPTEEQVFDLLVGLQTEAQVFCLVDEPLSYRTQALFKEWGIPESIQRSLIFLADWGTIPAQPLLMDFMSRWKSGSLSTPKVLRLLGAVQSLVVRRYVAQIPPHDLRSTLARLTLKMSGGSDQQYEQRLLAGLAEPGRRWPTDEEFTGALVTRPFYRPTNTRPAYLILRRLAEEIEGKEAPQIQLGKSSTSYSIEHVLPQTVDGTEWLEQLADWGDTNPLVTWNSRRHTIGNLTLTAFNSELSNRSFAFKREWIAENAYLKLSTAIVEEEEWTRRSIENRSQALAALALKLWPR